MRTCYNTSEEFVTTQGIRKVFIRLSTKKETPGMIRDCHEKKKICMSLEVKEFGMVLGFTSCYDSNSLLVMKNLHISAE